MSNRILVLSIFVLSIFVSCSKDKITEPTPNTCTGITIGSQVWMCKNLDIAYYRNGDLIPQVTDSTTWSNLTTGAWCYYNNDPALGAIYGKLYNWYAVNDSRGLAPSGWHVSLDAEWKTMEMYLGMTQAEADAEGRRGTNEGGKLKEAGTSHWNSPNTGATNESGFSALPGGYRGVNGSFGSVGSLGYWWSSSEYSTTVAWFRTLSLDYADFVRYGYSKGYGFSVRCVRDN